MDNQQNFENPPWIHPTLLSLARNHPSGLRNWRPQTLRPINFHSVPQQTQSRPQTLRPVTFTPQTQKVLIPLGRVTQPQTFRQDSLVPLVPTQNSNLKPYLPTQKILIPLGRVTQSQMIPSSNTITSFFSEIPRQLSPTQKVLIPLGRVTQPGTPLQLPPPPPPNQYILPLLTQINPVALLQNSASFTFAPESEQIIDKHDLVQSKNQDSVALIENNFSFPQKNIKISKKRELLPKMIKVATVSEDVIEKKTVEEKVYLPLVPHKQHDKVIETDVHFVERANPVKKFEMKRVEKPLKKIVKEDEVDEVPTVFRRRKRKNAKRLYRVIEDGEILESDGEIEDGEVQEERPNKLRKLERWNPTDHI